MTKMWNYNVFYSIERRGKTVFQTDHQSRSKKQTNILISVKNANKTFKFLKIAGNEYLNVLKKLSLYEFSNNKTCYRHL